MKRSLQKMWFVLIILSGLCYSNALGQDRPTRNINLIGPMTEQVNMTDYSRVFYVSNDKGSEQYDRGSSENPFRSINKALKESMSASAEQRTAILVAGGLYQEGTIKMNSYVDLFGGFDPQNWQRDIHRYSSIIDGQQQRRVVIGADDARIDGFVIRNGSVHGHGAGVFCNDTSPLISNNFIVDNQTLTPENFNHSRIHQDGHHGGGIASFYNAIPVIRNNFFTGNKTEIGNGAGIAFYGWARIEKAPQRGYDDNRMNGGWRPLLENNLFCDNIAGVADTARTRSSNGGAISCAFEARPIIRNNLVSNNQALGRGDAGGIYVEYFSYPDVIGNWLLGNVGDDDGGAFYAMKMSHPLLKDNFIAGNRTSGKGVGGIRLSKEGRARIKNNIIVHNSWGGVRSVDSYMELENNLIVRNGEAFGVSFINLFAYFQPGIIRNNIIRENQQGAVEAGRNAGNDWIIEKNNVDDQWTKKGKNNYDQAIDLGEAIQGYVQNITFDEVRYETKLFPEETISQNNNLVGRVIHLRDRWGVIKRAEEDSLIISGYLDSELSGNLQFEILPEYQVK